MNLMRNWRCDLVQCPPGRPTVFTLPACLYIAASLKSQCINVTVPSDTRSVSLPWDVSRSELGHSLGSDTLRGDQVRFKNVNSIHISSQMLQETELLWGVDVVSQQVILRKSVLQSGVDPGAC